MLPASPLLELAVRSPDGPLSLPGRLPGMDGRDAPGGLLAPPALGLPPLGLGLPPLGLGLPPLGLGLPPD